MVFVSFNISVYTQNILNFDLPMMFYVLLCLNRTSSCCGWRYNRRDPFICSPWNNYVCALEKNLPCHFLWKAHQSCQNNQCKCHFSGSGKFWNSTKKHKVRIFISFLKRTLCNLFQLVKWAGDPNISACTENLYENISHVLFCSFRII